MTPEVFVLNSEIYVSNSELLSQHKNGIFLQFRVRFCILLFGFFGFIRSCFEIEKNEAFFQSFESRLRRLCNCCSRFRLFRS